MELSQRHEINYKILQVLTFILLLTFNLSSFSTWNYTLIVSLSLVLIVFNLVINKISHSHIFSIEKTRLNIWINYFLISALIWLVGGINNPSFHIYHTFIIISSMALLNRREGIIFFILSNLFFVVLTLQGVINFYGYSTFLYITISGLFIGYFIDIHNKKGEILDRKVREFEALYKISKIIDTFPSTKVILDNIAEVVAKALDIDECIIMLYNEESDVLSTRARYGNINSAMEDAVFAKGEGISGKVLATKESVISSDLLRDQEVLKSYKYDFGIRSCAIIPLVYKGKGMGVIAVYSVEKYEFNPDTVEMLDIIASRIVSVLENDKLFKEVKLSSITDGLTRLYNHRYFYEALEREYERAIQNDSGLFLLMIDIDKFKLINDKYGHVVGDKVLREISNIIKTNIRNSDIAARYGGEEFAIIIPGVNKENVQIVIERIRQKIKKLGENIEQLKSENVEITVSIGIACYPRCTKDISELVDVADVRMYQGKQMGGDNVVYDAVLSPSTE